MSEKQCGPKLKCLECGDIIQSKHVHNFVTCKCGKVSIDGGGDYARILGSEDNWEFMLEGTIEDCKVSNYAKTDF